MCLLRISSPSLPFTQLIDYIFSTRALCIRSSTVCDQVRIRGELDDVRVSLPVLLDVVSLPFGVLVRAPEKVVSGYNARLLVVLAIIGDLLEGNFAPAVLVLFFQLLEHLQSLRRLYSSLGNLVSFDVPGLWTRVHTLYPFVYVLI
jgi:hypothetical protein